MTRKFFALFVVSFMLVLFAQTMRRSDIGRGDPANGVIEEFRIVKLRDGSFLVRIPADMNQLDPNSIDGSNPFFSDDTFLAWAEVRKGNTGRWKNYSVKKVTMTADKLFLEYFVGARFDGYTLKTNAFAKINKARGDKRKPRDNNVNVGGSHNARGKDGEKIPADPSAVNEGNGRVYYQGICK